VVNTRYITFVLLFFPPFFSTKNVKGTRLSEDDAEKTEKVMIMIINDMVETNYSEASFTNSGH